MNDDMNYDFFNNPTYFGKNNYSPSSIIAKLVLIEHIAKQVDDEMESAEAMALLKTIECQDHNRVINFIKANFYKYKNTVDYAIHNKQNRSDACPNGVEGCDCSSEESGRCDQILNINILKLIKDKTIEHINKYSKIYIRPMTVVIGDKLIKYNNSNFTKTLSIFSILRNDHGELKAENEAPNILVDKNDIEEEFKNIIAQIDKHGTSDGRNKNKKEKLQKMYEEFKKDCKNPLYQYAKNNNIISKMQI